ncbi:MAG: YceI family protein [Hyphomicrobiaceae bacterium]
MTCQLLRALILCVSIFTSGALRAETYLVRAGDSRSQIGFQIRQFGIFWISGRFQRFSGKLTLHGARAGASRVRIEIDAASINSDFPARDRYLRSEAVLATRHYPKITFQSTKTKVTGPDTALVTGDMTFREITRRVAIRVRYVHGSDRDGRGAGKQFIGQTSFRLSEFGVTGIPTLTSDRVFLTIRLALSPT